MKILKKIFSFLPLKARIILQYRRFCGRWPNLKEPKRFSEKLQVYKLYYRDEKMIHVANKVTAPEYIIEKGYKDILVPRYGVFNNVDDINFEILPNEFIIKLNNGSGHNIIVKDKDNIKEIEIKKTLKRWLKYNPKLTGTEWNYNQIENQIIIEKLLIDNGDYGLVDYKYFCFEGKCNYIYVNVFKENNLPVDKLSFYDVNFNNLNIYRKEYPPIEETIKKPLNHHKMLAIAEDLSKAFPHARIDFYNVDGKIYFGEITFFTGSGYLNFNDDDFDFKLGEDFKYDLFERTNYT